MSDDVAISFEGVGKMYKIFPSRRDHVLDALGITQLLRRDNRLHEFWALRDIDITLRRGERLGIIGRNGAGKTTLLKLVTQNLAPTTGTVTVNGNVQALLEIGGGLHPEFTGRENIGAALSYLGLTTEEIEAAEDEIAEFTELGRFLDQPFKTYSQGMQARLSFAIATTVQPEILIVDEILGAGDAYFFTRSTERMRRMIEGGASVLLVSHALDQIIRFCDEAIWVDRGRITMRGPSTEVAKAYERFIRELDDKRLQAQNRKSQDSSIDAFERDSHTDYLTVKFEPPPGPGSQVDIARVRLLRDGVLEDEVAVGAAQDADSTQSARVLPGSAWSRPREHDGTYFRSIEADEASTDGEIALDLWFFYPESTYELEVQYRAPDDGARITIGRGGAKRLSQALAATPDWTTVRLAYAEPDAPTTEETAATDERRERTPAGARVSHWPGEGSIRIESVRLLGDEGREQAVFEAGSRLRLELVTRIEQEGTHDVTPAVTIYRADGILVTNNPGEPLQIRAGSGALARLTLDFDRINLGDGRYLVSAALYRYLSHVGESVAYDLVDRSYEFEVRGNEPFNNGVFRHAATWAVEVDPAPTTAGVPEFAGSRVDSDVQR